MNAWYRGTDAQKSWGVGVGLPLEGFCLGVDATWRRYPWRGYASLGILFFVVSVWWPRRRRST